MRIIFFIFFILNCQLSAQIWEFTFYVPTSEATSRLAAAIPTNDILMIQENPAYGGILAENTNFSYSRSYNNKYIMDEPTCQTSYGLFAGFDFEKVLNLPVKISISHQKNNYNYGEHTIWNYPAGPITSTQYSYSDMYSFSASIGSTVKASFGITKKGFIYNYGIKERDMDYGGWDYGVLFVIPLHKLIRNGLNIYSQKHLDINLGMTYMLGSSIRNSGDKFYHHDYMLNGYYRALYKEFNLCHSLTFSGILNLNGKNLKIITATLGTEAHDLLISFGNIIPEYYSPPGDIKFVDNLILGKSDEEISISRGYILSLFETVSFFEGYETGGKFDAYWGKGYGFMFESAGIFKAIHMLLESNITSFMAGNLNFSYHYAENNRGDRYFRTMNYFQLEVKNIASLF